jgi:hypothetical protein
MAAPGTTQHQCLIYEGFPTSQLPALAAVAKHKLEAGSRCLVLNSPAMVAGFLSVSRPLESMWLTKSTKAL